MEVADIICSFPQYLPCVVLSAMGKVRTHAYEGGGRHPAHSPMHVQQVRGSTHSGGGFDQTYCLTQIHKRVWLPNFLPHDVVCVCLQTTNLLLECGDLALVSSTDMIPNLEPLQ